MQCRVNLHSHDSEGIQRGQGISAYVDNIIVQSKLKKDHIEDLCRAFSNLHNVGLKLNPEKCIFDVNKGKLLGYLVLARGNEANLEKSTQSSTWNH